MTAPFKGIRVLDLSRIFAAPYATQLLADMGADVVKVEKPGTGDEMRNYGPPFLKDRDGNDTKESPYYLSANRNKRSITINLSDSEGQELIRRLAADSDVFVENFKVGDLKRHGLGYEDIRKINPKIIYCSVTGFGQTGPYSGRPALDGTIQAMGGIMSITGEPDGQPQRVGIVVGDYVAGMHLAWSIASALYSRDANGGEGRYIDLALLDSLISALSHRAMHYLISGQVPPRVGTGTPNAVPAQVFATADGDVFLSAAGDDQFARLCKALDLTHLPADPRFNSRRGRFDNKPALIAILSEKLAGGTMAHWIDSFAAVNLVCSPVNRLDQVFDDPQVKHRGMVIETEHPQAGPMKLLRNPVRMSGMEDMTYTAPPIMGQHTDEVLKERLGMSVEDIAGLRARGVV
jgi:crotonobetainyl-CoA:carnitine CoA-transferase CaiB-like acyl-CoA transferase